MRIGNIDLGEKPLFLAPMEDVTDASFRYICKEYGADMMYTEFISSDGLIRDARKSLEKLVTYDYEAPIGIQIYGNIPEAMVEAAQMAEKAAEIAGGHGADLVDINFGCPVNKIARRGAGSGMMKEPDKMVEITKMVVDAVKLPVTVKTRLGWDEDSKIIVELAERLQDTGIAALTVHGRTRCQMYKGEADWTLIGKIKENPRMHIPIIGNGDIDSPQKAKEAFDRYGVDGIMIGRATFGHPWIFKEVRHYLDTGELLPPMSVGERVELAKKHLAKSLEIKGDRVGILEMRRHLSCYFKGLPDFKPTRLKLVTTDSPEELFKLLDYVADTWGEVPPPETSTPWENAQTTQLN
ncbi:MAG: tRNA dihydrouridine synthase DusB [Candidatus Cryptobacteroides sp.]